MFAHPSPVSTVYYSIYLRAANPGGGVLNTYSIYSILYTYILYTLYIYTLYTVLDGPLLPLDKHAASDGSHATRGPYSHPYEGLKMRRSHDLGHIFRVCTVCLHYQLVIELAAFSFAELI